MKFFILRNLKYASRVIVQTNTIKNYLTNNKKIMNVLIAPNVLNLDEFSNNKVSDNVYDGIKFNLLFLSKFYPHKNFDILEDVCRIIRENSLNVTITLTLDENKRNDFRILKKLYPFKDIIKNIGVVDYSNLKEIYESHHAMFLPTLLESFSSTYIEAIYFKRLILTSDRDFSREICGNYAVYFDPLSPQDIVEKIKFSIKNFKKLNDAIAKIETSHLPFCIKSDSINSLIFNSI